MVVFELSEKSPRADHVGKELEGFFQPLERLGCSPAVHHVDRKYTVSRRGTLYGLSTPAELRCHSKAPRGAYRQSPITFVLSFSRVLCAKENLLAISLLMRDTGGGDSSRVPPFLH
jgi:hypothetical protein